MKKSVEIASASGLEIAISILFIFIVAVPIFYFFTKEIVKDMFPRHFNKKQP